MDYVTYSERRLIFKNSQVNDSHGHAISSSLSSLHFADVLLILHSEWQEDHRCQLEAIDRWKLVGDFCTEAYLHSPAGVTKTQWWTYWYWN